MTYLYDQAFSSKLVSWAAPFFFSVRFADIRFGPCGRETGLLGAFSSGGGDTREDGHSIGHSFPVIQEGALDTWARPAPSWRARPNCCQYWAFKAEHFSPRHGGPEDHDPNDGPATSAPVTET